MNFSTLNIGMFKIGQGRVRKKWQPANRVGGEHLGYKEKNGEHLEVKQRKNNVKAKISFKEA